MEANVIVMVVRLIPIPIRRAAVQRVVEVAAATNHAIDAPTVMNLIICLAVLTHKTNYSAFVIKLNKQVVTPTNYRLLHT